MADEITVRVESEDLPPTEETTKADEALTAALEIVEIIEDKSGLTNEMVRHVVEELRHIIEHNRDIILAEIRESENRIISSMVIVEAAANGELKESLQEPETPLETPEPVGEAPKVDVIVEPEGRDEKPRRKKFLL